MKTIVLILSLLLSLCGYSQKAGKRAPLTGRHELRLGLGIQPLIPDVYIDYELSSSRSSVFNYQANQVKAPSFNADWSYRLRHWLSLGAMVSFGGIYRKYNDSFDDIHLFTYRREFLSLMPIVRFYWFNSRSVNFYSSVGFGLGVSSVKNNKGYEGIHELALLPSYTLNFFGISVGRKLFGYTELGFSSSGIIQFGIGYRY